MLKATNAIKSSGRFLLLFPSRKKEMDLFLIFQEIL